MMQAIETAANSGTAAVLNMYDGSVPADADASIGASTLLAQLVCSASIFTSVADDTPGAIATFAAITSDLSADASGTCTYARLLTQSGGTTRAQFTVGTSATEIVFASNVFTLGAEIGISAFTLLQNEG